MSVACADGRPVAVALHGARLPVAEVLDQWRIADEWWRAPQSRRYVRLVLADGRPLTLFEDELTGHWYAQRYPAGVAA